MQTIINQLNDIVGAAFEKCGYDKKYGKVTVSNRPDLCQFQCNGAMIASKQYKKNPSEIADEIVSILNKEDIFELAEAVKPGFLNMSLSDETIVCISNEILKDKNCGIDKLNKPENIIVDYGGANVAKPLHVGHLRPAIIGEAIKRLARKLGYNAIGDVHLGDWGLQIGLVITEYREMNPNSVYFDESYTGEYPELDITMSQLNEIYPRASKKSKEDKIYNEKAHQNTVELQNKKRGHYAFWKEIMRVSVADLKKNYERLNVDFDLWYGESDSQKYIPDMINSFIEKGLAYEDQGALIVDVAKEDDKAPIPPVIVRKTDGSDIYATTDLATIIQRVKDYDPTMILYVVDNRQSLHFEQVFRCAKKAGLVSENVLLELDGNGTINGKDGKPYKTRDGGVMRLGELIENVIESAKEKLNSSKVGAELSEEERNKIAFMVGISALKFGDLMNHRSKDYIFDLDKFLSFEGKTGPYLLYTIVRFKSILNKAKENGYRTSLVGVPSSDAQRDIMLKIMTTNEVLWQAFSDKGPSTVCDNAFTIASLANKFYYENKILSEENEEKRSELLALCELILKSLQMHMEILAIEVPEKM